MICFIVLFILGSENSSKCSTIELIENDFFKAKHLNYDIYEQIWEERKGTIKCKSTMTVSSPFQQNWNILSHNDLKRCEIAVHVCVKLQVYMYTDVISHVHWSTDNAKTGMFQEQQGMYIFFLMISWWIYSNIVWSCPNFTMKMGRELRRVKNLESWYENLLLIRNDVIVQQSKILLKIF